MKKMIKAASINESVAMDTAKRILKEGKALLNIMDDSRPGFLEANDLMPLYDELIDTLPALDFMIKSGSVEVGEGADNQPF